MSGAIDFSECPQGGISRRPWCQCGDCSVCGWPKHCALHGPAYGEPPGSKPYDHEYQPTPAGETPPPRYKRPT